MTAIAAPVTTPRRIGVIETGERPVELWDEFTDYPDMIARWLGEALPNAVFEGIRVVTGQPLGEPQDFDGYVITGSKHGAYDDLPWIPPLEEFIRECGRSNIPVFGICFGHQILAQAFGARVEKSERGWGVGVQRYEIKGYPADGGISVHVFHQDQVIEVPEGATLLGGNDFCPIGALQFGDHALSVQFHPEFEGRYMTRLLEVRAGLVLPDEITEGARRTLREHPDNSTVAKWARAFFESSWSTGTTATCTP